MANVFPSQKYLQWWLEWLGWAMFLVLRRTGTKSSIFMKLWGLCFWFLWTIKIILLFVSWLIICFFPQCGTSITIQLGVADCVEGDSARRSGICLLPCWRRCREGLTLYTCCSVAAGEFTTAPCLTSNFSVDLYKEDVMLNTNGLNNRGPG